LVVHTLNGLKAVNNGRNYTGCHTTRLGAHADSSTLDSEDFHRAHRYGRNGKMNLFALILSPDQCSGSNLRASLSSSK
jgi:hypothetical protein